jgi:hypothetical protein
LLFDALAEKAQRERAGKSEQQRDRSTPEKVRATKLHIAPW